jgi:hypothetical protein
MRDTLLALALCTIVAACLFAAAYPLLAAIGVWG